MDYHYGYIVVVFLVISGFMPLSLAQNGIYVGQGSGKHFFALRGTHDWFSALNYCHTYGFMSASITTESDYQLVLNFLNTTTLYPEGERAFWIPATDHRVEGTYQWISNLALVDFWANILPSQTNNRSANCLILNSDGSFRAESCIDGLFHHVLCETPQLQHRPPTQELGAQKPSTHKIYIEGTVQIAPRLIPIGGVGNKLYFVENELNFENQNLPGLLDFCHAQGMRLAAPENDFELQYLVDYVTISEIKQYALAGTDMLSISCLQSNAGLRWFYTGNAVNRTTFYGTNWYKCLIVTPIGLAVPDCFGIRSQALCELST